MLGIEELETSIHPKLLKNLLEILVESSGLEQHTLWIHRFRNIDVPNHDNPNPLLRAGDGFGFVFVDKLGMMIYYQIYIVLMDREYQQL